MHLNSWGLNPFWPEGPSPHLCSFWTSEDSVFKITSEGAFTILYTFAGMISDQVYAPLLQAADGNFYGTSPLDGVNGLGTIFEVTPSGAVTILHSFDGADGSDPYGGLVQGSDGRLYGATSGDGLGGGGTIFGFSLSSGVASPPTVNPGGVVSASAFGEFTTIAPGSWIEIYGANLAVDTRYWTTADFHGYQAPLMLDGTSVFIANQPAFVSFISPGQVNVQVPSVIPSGSQPLVVNVSGLASNSYTITVNGAEPGLLAPASFKVGSTSMLPRCFRTTRPSRFLAERSRALAPARLSLATRSLCTGLALAM